MYGAMKNVVPPIALAAFLSLGYAQEQNNVGCFVPVQCEGGVSVGIRTTDTPIDCLDFCKSIPECLMFTHYDDSNYCIGYANCPATNDDCSDCISGEFETNFIESSLKIAIYFPDLCVKILSLKLPACLHRLIYSQLFSFLNIKILWLWLIIL